MGRRTQLEARFREEPSRVGEAHERLRRAKRKEEHI